MEALDVGARHLVGDPVPGSVQRLVCVLMSVNLGLKVLKYTETRGMVSSMSLNRAAVKKK